jgi:hypothetical protein
VSGAPARKISGLLSHGLSGPRSNGIGGQPHPIFSPERAARKGTKDYAVKYKRAFYGLPELGWIIEIAPYDVSVNVVFLGGADFDPPPPLGTTNRPATSR